MEAHQEVENAAKRFMSETMNSTWEWSSLCSEMGPLRLEIAKSVYLGISWGHLTSSIMDLGGNWLKIRKVVSPFILRISIRVYFLQIFSIEVIILINFKLFGFYFRVKVNFWMKLKKFLKLMSRRFPFCFSLFHLAHRSIPLSCHARLCPSSSTGCGAYSCNSNSFRE